MVINFQTGNAANSMQTERRTDTANAAGAMRGQTSKTGNAREVSGAEYRKDNPFQGKMVVKENEKGKSFSEIQQEAGNMDVAALQDYMTVMSNTMSEEDYAKMEEDGFCFRSMSPEEAVTIVDKIKAELASSGTVIAGYNDDINIETLSAAVGSETLARAVAESFRQADLPLNSENINNIRSAWDMAGSLTPPTDGSLSYMIDQDLEPEIWDFYLAQNSGMNGDVKSPQTYFRQEAGGYLTEGYTGGAMITQDQIDKVIRESGIEPDEESRKDAEWLLDRGLTLTQENLSKLSELKSCRFPLSEKEFADAVSAAVAEGKKPVHANLSGRENIYEKAGKMLAYYSKDENFKEIGDQLTVRRQLEEIRFRMTAEVNVKLLKSNYFIDTAPMEELVSALRKAESEVAAGYFPADAEAVEKYHVLNETRKVVSDLPFLPADILGNFRVGQDAVSLEEFHKEGTALRETYARANESYEALMTTPRKDLGDSMKKAFANVDDIVRDLKLPLNEENRRAVRILGYNRMEITAQNVEKVSAADNEVQSLIRKMTPAMTLKMIRDGMNPLEKNIEELNRYLDGQEESYEQQAESYSRFLYKLENKKEITKEERESYIGIYRLIRQIEKTDGAAVGALVNTQADLQFSNLLSAVRSRKFKGLDVRIEDSFGAVSEVVRSGKSISDQIRSAFVRNVDEILEEIFYDQEAERNYYSEEMEQIRSAAAEVSHDVIGLLQKGEAAVNAENILAAQALLQGEETLFAAFSKNTKKTENAELLKNVWEKLDDADEWESSYHQMLDEMDGEVQETSLQASDSMDVRQLSLLHKQISVARQVSNSEEYFIPMYVGERLSRVHLTIEHSDDTKGEVAIEMDLEEGPVNVRFTLKNGRLDGFFVGNGENEVTKLKEAADIVNSRISEGVPGLERVKPGIFSVVHASSYVADRQGTEARPDKTDGAEHQELYRVAKVFLEAIR